MKKGIEQAVKKAVPNASIYQVKSVSGGDISEAFAVETDKQWVFVKAHFEVAKDLFLKEAKGLEEIRKTKTLSVPAVLGVGDQADDVPHLVLSYINVGPKGVNSDELLGEGLAAMHDPIQPFYGLGYENYLGTIKQEKGEFMSWPRFYAEKRLQPLIDLCTQKGLFTEGEAATHRQLADKLDQLLPEDPGASLLHGDLWAGNRLFDENGEPFLIDPAILYGDRQMDLALTQLFGGYSQRFYDAYESASGQVLKRELWPLYQLFHIYMHAASFGGPYVQEAHRMVRRYVG
ncbi:fructosamine kinase family protein [Shouchella shacheensis]|uniref:fructosamine kinase family protein n=1 Tax=Shouchella shacheensis TaxID=1649580 RepID=UPI0007402AFF|nr:fructosamine kinase family protein [Shouchella shacheensis]